MSQPLNNPHPLPEEVLAAKEQLEILLHTMPDQVWFKDLEGRYVMVNDVYVAARGVPREHIVGRTDFDLFPADLAERFRADDARALREGRRIVIEGSLPGPDGAVVWYEEAKAPVRSRAGEAVGTVGISRDITERRQNEVFFQGLIETAPYGIYTTDLEGRLTLANATLGELLGYDPDALLGRHFLDLVAPEDREEAMQRFRQRLAGRSGVRDFEIRGFRADGAARLLHVRSADILIDGVTVGIQGAVRDITDLREREVAVRRAERMASTATLIAGVAHELNNPLTAIKSFAQLLLLDPRAPDEQEALDTMLREADRAAGIVAGLRQLARDSQAGPHAPREPLALDQLARRVLEACWPALEAAGVEVVLDPGRDLPPVVGNREQLEQALGNLIDNAEQALARAAGPRRLEVRVGTDEGRVWVRIEDSGPGIEPEHLGRLFDPFFTTRPPGAGVGLGLSLAHSIVAEHGGEVQVESVPGQGAVFCLVLPAAPRPPQRAAARPASLPAARPVRVLVVDDEEPIRFSVSHFLARRGHQVEVASDGGEALQRIDEAAARGETFEVILSDIRMPGMDGEQLLARLQQRGDGSERRIVFMSGDAASARALREILGQQIPVLNKPFELQAVARLIEERAAQALDVRGWS